MKRAKLCTGKLDNFKIEKPKRGVENMVWWGFFTGVRPANVKRIRVKCPACGRKLMSSITQNDREIFHSLPPHKPKKWWKKPKDVSKHKERAIR